MAKKHNPQLIVALDVDTLEEAKTLVGRLNGDVGIYKVGSQLFTACGPAVVRHLLKAGKKVFLDLKFHDIPNTVANAVSAAVGLNEGERGIFMCTLHTSGGGEMLRRAVAAATKTAHNIGVMQPLLVGVTILTSEAKRDNILKLVLESARLARESGLNGVVASCQEAVAIRNKFGDDFVIVTPGIRPEGSQAEDQKRVATPQEAMASGSDFLVVGRPIIKADNPSVVTRRILSIMSQA
jgi:orotidine-5'-phosphate decarboxylase